MKKITGLEKNWWKCSELEVGQEFCLRGVVIGIKQMKSFSFVIFQNSTDVFQAVTNLELPRVGSWVEISGTVNSGQIKNQLISNREIELHIKGLKILSEIEEELPFGIGNKELNIGNATLFNMRPYSLRHQRQRAIFRVQSEIMKAFRNYFESLGLVEMRTPKIVKEGAEGGANIFSLEYFGKTAYLTQSPQFYKEFGVGIFHGVFEMGPVFRAEAHNTSRHLSEYTSVDVEIGHIESFREVMALEFEALRYVLESVKSNCEKELELFEVEVNVPEFIPSISFFEAKEITRSKELTDLSPEEEKTLSKYALKKWGSEFLFVTNYPESKRPFYTMLGENETESFDLLYKGVEITTGGQRVHSYKEINERILSKGLSPENFEFFTVAHKSGLPPHGGFGLGLERLTQKILGLENIKEACMYPRDTTRLSP